MAWARCGRGASETWASFGDARPLPAARPWYIAAPSRAAGLSPRPWGEVAEWLKAHAWNACIGETLSRVRIPLSPPLSQGKIPGRFSPPASLGNHATIRHARRRETVSSATMLGQYQANCAQSLWRLESRLRFRILRCIPCLGAISLIWRDKQRFPQKSPPLWRSIRATFRRHRRGWRANIDAFPRSKTGNCQARDPT